MLDRVEYKRACVRALLDVRTRVGGRGGALRSSGREAEVEPPLVQILVVVAYKLYLVGFCNSRSRTREGRFPRPLHTDVG